MKDFYFYIVEYYDEYINDTRAVKGFVYGTTYTEAIEKIVKQYGEDAIQSVKIEYVIDSYVLELPDIRAALRKRNVILEEEKD